MKKGQGLPINIVVMLIIGIIIFSLGIALFFQIFQDSESQVLDLSNDVRNNIAQLQCPRDQSICSPSYEMQNGDKQSFSLYISNNLEENQAFTVSLDLIEIDSGKFGVQNANGAILIQYYTGEVSVLSGSSASVPFSVQASRVAQTPTSFIVTARLLNSNGNEIGKTPIIIRVE